MTRVFAIPEYETPRMAGGPQRPAADERTRFAAGDEAAFATAVHEHGPVLVRLARRLLAWRGDAEDVVQEAFVTAYLKRGSYRGDSAVATWLGRIVINRCRQIERRRRLWPRMVSAWLERRRPEEAGRDEVAETVRAAVGRLTMPEREAVVLYYLGEQSAAQVCDLLGITEAALNTRLHRARRKLGEALRNVHGRLS